MENLAAELIRLNPEKQPKAEELMENQVNGFQFLVKMINRESDEPCMAQLFITQTLIPRV